MKISIWACFAAAVCLAVPPDLGAQARIGGGHGGGGVRSGGARGGSMAVGARGGAFRGMPRGRSAGSIQTRGLPRVQRTPSRVQRPSSGDPRGSLRRAVPPATVGSPGFPGTDRVVLNPPRTHGNVVAPGTPGRFNPGNPIAPGTPTIPGSRRQFEHGRHHGVHSKVLTFGHGHHFGIPIVYVPYGFGYRHHTEYIREDYVEEEYLEEEEESAERIPNVVYVDQGTRTASSSEYVIQVQPDPPPASGTVFEVRPTTSPAPPSRQKPAEGEVEAEPAEEPSAGGEESAFYLIALRNGSIYTSREHWLEGDTLHYITRSGAHNLISISEVDTDLTAQLNRERGLPFVLEVREREE